MSEENTTPQTPQQGSSPSLGGIALPSIISIVAGLASAALGAGWPGIVALGVMAFGGAFGLNILFKAINKRVDARDLANAGANSGNTAVDMANQASKNRHDLAELKRQQPPVKPQ